METKTPEPAQEKAPASDEKNSNVLTGKESYIPRYAKGANLREGLGLSGKRVQESPASVKPGVVAWLKDLGFSVQ